MRQYLAGMVVMHAHDAEAGADDAPVPVREMHGAWIMELSFPADLVKSSEVRRKGKSLHGREP